MTKVAIQGIRGSYSEAAAIEAFGDDFELIECSSFEATFRSLETGDADKAVIPVRNSIVGEIVATKRLLKTYGSSVLSHLDVVVEHVLATRQGTRFEDVMSVRSHFEALRQCSEFFEKHTYMRQIAGHDTASSIRMIVEKDIVFQAAICSERAAEIYGATILRRNVANRHDNITTFAVIAK